MLILDFPELKRLVEDYMEFDEFVFDVETKGPHRGDPRRNDVFWISLAGPGRADVIPFGHPRGNVLRYLPALTPTGKISTAATATPTPVFGQPPLQLYPEEVFGGLEPLLFSDRRKIGHNVKFDLCSVAKYYDALPPPPYGDTMVLAHILNENQKGIRPYSLGSCVQREIGFEYEKGIGKEVEVVPFDIAARYSYWDSKYCWLLWQTLMPGVEAQNLWRIFDLEMDVIEVVCHMEQAGVDIDVAAIKKVEASFQEEIEETYARIRKAAGYDINLHAAAQLRELLFKTRKHKPKVFTEKTQEPSTSAKALESYMDDPVVADVVSWLSLSKIKTTFLTSIREKLVDGKVHCDFDQRGARTGRFSSRTPNLQNIPTRQTKVVRELFIARPGYKMIVADYSQSELRLLAHFSQDPMLLRAYNEGLNLHMITAKNAYHVEEPNDRQYGLAKNVNFTLAYRGSPETISGRYEVPLREAQKLYDAFYNTYRNVEPWQKSVVAECKKRRVSKQYAEWTGKTPCEPYVPTLMGRRRRLPEIFWSDRKARNYAERQAINHRIQGSAGDLNKLALVHVLSKFKAHPEWRIILTIHDEVVAIVPEAEAEEAQAVMKEAMENLPLNKPLRVPLVADVKVCARWSEK